MDLRKSEGIMVEPSESRLSGITRRKCAACCFIAIATATTVLFFKGESLLEIEYVKRNLSKIRSSLTLNSTERQQSQKYKGESLLEIESVRRNLSNITSPLTLNSTESQQSQKYKVICMILTRVENWQTKRKAVGSTWATRCHKAIFFYTRIGNCSSQPICNDSNAVGLNVPDGRGHLTAKTIGALNYSYTKYSAEADYFLKADDDTYVITENLQRILSRFHSVSLLYLGRLFTDILPKGYNSGGAGYVISKPAAKLLVENRSLHPSECQADGGYEDVEIGKCLAKFGIYPQDEMDSARKQIFHSENPFRILQVDKSGPGSYSYININGAEFGNKNAKRSHMLSNWTATIHYVTPPEMYMYEFLLYHLKRGNIYERTDS